MMKSTSILFLTLLLLYCSKAEENGVPITNLHGQWIEVKTGTDTLAFESLDNFEIMDLRRGKETFGGHLLPKSGSGPYRYTIAQDIISLNWMISSNSSFQDFSFLIQGNELSIGNFYGSDSGETLTFKKLN